MNLLCVSPSAFCFQTMVIGMIATRFNMSAEDAEALQNYVIVMEMFW